MKTVVIMERTFQGGYKIRQNSASSFFNANDLLEVFNKNHHADKRLSDYLTTNSTQEYMGILLLEGEFEKIIETKRGKNGGTWMHPYLFVDFAMWLSPQFKFTVIRWVYDNLIKLRHEAGDSFKLVNEALFDKKPNSSPYEYANEARMINKLVFGSPNPDQRNSANDQQLSLLKSLQKLDIHFIRKGLNYYERHEELKKSKETLMLAE